MKKLLLFIFLLGSISAATAQVRPKVYLGGSTINNTVIARGGIRGDSVMTVPLRDTLYIPERKGDMVVRPQDGLLYIYLGQWFVFQNVVKDIYLTQGLTALNDSTAALGGRFTKDDTISLAANWSMLFDSTVHFRIRGSNTSALDVSTIFEVQSTVRGVLFSKMNTGQMNAIASPTAGLQVYNTDSLDYCVYNGTVWLRGSNLYVQDGFLYSDRSLSGNNHFLSLGTSGSPTNFTSIYSNSTVGLFGIPTYSAFPTIADANYVAPANQATFKLPVITANRTFTPPASGGNKVIYIWNGNNAAFTWSPAGGSIFKDASFNTLSSFAGNTFYQFMNDGTNWVQMNAIPGLQQVLTVGNISTLGMSVGNFITTGTLTVPLVVKSSNYNPGVSDVIIEFTASASCTLPTASTNVGRILYIKNRSAGNIILTGMESGEFNIMSPSGTTGASITITSDGTGWIILSMGE